LLHSDVCDIANFGTLIVPKPGPNGLVTQATYSGNSSSALYRFAGFQAPLSGDLVFGAGRTIPIKFQVTDNKAQPITALAVITSLQVVGPSGIIDLKGALSFDTKGNQFAANWQTKGLPAGDYSLALVFSDSTVSIKYVQITTTGSGANAQAADDSDI